MTSFDNMSPSARKLEVALRIYEARMLSPKENRFQMTDAGRRVDDSVAEASLLLNKIGFRS